MAGLKGKFTINLWLYRRNKLVNKDNEEFSNKGNAFSGLSTLLIHFILIFLFYV